MIGHQLTAYHTTWLEHAANPLPGSPFRLKRSLAVHRDGVYNTLTLPVSVSVSWWHVALTLPGRDDFTYCVCYAAGEHSIFTLTFQSPLIFWKQLPAVLGLFGNGHLGMVRYRPIQASRVTGFRLYTWTKGLLKTHTHVSVSKEHDEMLPGRVAKGECLLFIILFNFRASCLTCYDSTVFNENHITVINHIY